MKQNRSKEWYKQKIALEGDLEVGAGMPWEKLDAQDKSVGNEDQKQKELVERIAFGSLVQLERRKKGLSIEKLANAALVNALELISIEHDPEHTPCPRTVHQLAKVFGIPERSLMQLSNLSTTHSAELLDEAVRFAAHSSTVTELTDEESSALNKFVAYLSSQGNG
ncbi:MAG: helix-turn-helix transcriptional regulator [Planctomycetota bacterium]|nr:helix-turn-helix transcriptional regulator [Planctomycetota bacterium]